MNNATLALNVARPPAPATQPTAAQPQDDAPPSRRFDAALDAARAEARPSRPQGEAGTKDKAAPVAAKATEAKAARPQDDKSPKKDEGTGSDGDGTSIATTMLSLIGVPPVVAGVATPAPGAAKDEPAAGTGMAGGAFAVASLAGALPAGAVAEAAAQGAKDAAGLALAPGAAPVAGNAAGAPALPSFAALLATQADAKAAKDDAGSSPDGANASPMPLAHAPGVGAGATPVMQLQATHPANSPQFAQELGEQIAWMGSGQVKEARIKLHPEELGSMDVRVNLDGGKVNVAVMAQHPAAVHAVQQTLSQLDSMLAHHGLSLGQADVGQRQAEQGGDGNQGATAGQGGDTAGASGGETLATSRVSRGLVDEVA